jgi:hypothetical protein
MHYAVCCAFFGAVTDIKKAKLKILTAKYISSLQEKFQKRAGVEDMKAT